MTTAADLWRDPIWQSLGVLAAVGFGVITLVLGVVTLYLARRRKLLTYEILSVTPLAAIKDDIGGRVQILFDLEPANDAQLLLVKFTNSGNLPIIFTDYERPVRVVLNKGVRILTAGITEVFPSSLNVTVQQGRRIRHPFSRAAESERFDDAKDFGRGFRCPDHG